MRYVKWVHDEILISKELSYMTVMELKDHLKRHAKYFNVSDDSADIIIERMTCN
jgi:hypothetical protein